MVRNERIGAAEADDADARVAAEMSPQLRAQYLAWCQLSPTTEPGEAYKERLLNDIKGRDLRAKLGLPADASPDEVAQKVAAIAQIVVLSVSRGAEKR